MKKIILGFALLLAGITAAVAVAAVTTSTATQCATTTSPTHVHADVWDGVTSSVTTVGGDPLSVCATATATATNSTDTVTTTVPGPTTTVTTTVSEPPPVTSHDYSTLDPGSGAMKLVTSPSTTSTNSITVAAGASSYNMTDGRNAVYTIVPGITGAQHGIYTAIVHVTSAFTGAQVRVALEQNGAFIGGGWTAYQNANGAGDLTFTVNDTASPNWVSTWNLQLFVGVKNSNASGSGTVSWQSGGLTTLDVPFSLSPPPSGSLLFDGSATKMNALDVHSVAGPSSPCLGKVIGPTTRGYFCVYSDPSDLWTCLCFIDNDISLASDSTLGKAYDVNVKTGDTNEWGGSKSADGAGQLSIRQDNDLGKWDYYGIAAKVPAWSGPLSDLYFVDIASLGYQTSSNDQVALGLYRSTDGTTLNYDLRVNGGYANGPQGNAPGTTHFRQVLQPVAFGQWDEFIIGVKWSTDTTGELKVWNRHPGGVWSVIFDRANIDTYLYGTITKADGTVENFAQDGSNWPTVINKIGLYFQEYGGETEHVQESGLTRSTDLATAEATLP